MIVALGDDGISKALSVILQLPIDQNSQWRQGPELTDTPTFLYGSRSVVSRDGKTILLIGGTRAVNDRPPNMLSKFWCHTANDCYWEVFQDSPLKLIRHDVMAFMAPTWLLEFIDCTD